MQNNSNYAPNQPMMPAQGKQPRSKPKKKNLNSASQVKNQKQRIKKIKTKAGKRGVVLNPYVMTLIDPENVHGVRYPDVLPKGTAVFKSLINRNAFYFPDSVIEPAGTVLNILSPTLINPLLSYQIETVTTPGSLTPDPLDNAVLSGAVTTVDDSVGLFPLTEDIATVSTGGDQMFIPTATQYNLRTLWHWKDQDFAFPSFRGLDINGAVFYGVPFGIGSTGQVTVRVNVLQGFPSTANPFNMTAVTTTGSVAFTPIAVTAGTLSATFTLSGATLLTIMNAGGYAPLPGVGFRIQNDSGREYLITSYVVSIATDSSLVSVSRAQPRFVGVSLPDERTYAQTIDQYRVVSMSAWYEYDGSDLSNGGQIASILYRGGQSAGENGLYNYQTVAEAPESYAGPLKHGTYTIWTPNSENDMLMRNLSPHGRWQYPFICNAAVVATPSQLNSIRIRIAINYEVVSTSQFYDFEKPFPNEKWISEAAVLLREHPCAMANGRHWDWIKGVAADAADMASGAGKWAYNNKDWILPAAGALASLI